MSDAAPSRTSAELAGRVLDERYRLERILGEGGLGVVWRATHLRLGKPVAVKVMQPEHLGAEGLRARFEREARSLAALSHPSIVDIIDYGVDVIQGREEPFLVMELLEGRTLDRALADGLEVERAMSIVCDILRALAYAHGQGFVHRDLKPQNVFLQAIPGGGELVRVLDFGLAKFVGDAPESEAHITRRGAVLGTPAYMAPEQATGSEVDARVDVYACAILLFEVLSGRLPFQARGADLLREHLLVQMPSISSVRTDLHVAPELDAFLARAGAKSPRDRFADAGRMLEAFVGLPSPALAALSGQPLVTRTGEMAAVGAALAVTIAAGASSSAPVSASSGSSAEPDATFQEAQPSPYSPAATVRSAPPEGMVGAPGATLPQRPALGSAPEASPLSSSNVASSVSPSVMTSVTSAVVLPTSSPVRWMIAALLVGVGLLGGAVAVLLYVFVLTPSPAPPSQAPTVAPMRPIAPSPSPPAPPATELAPDPWATPAPSPLDSLHAKVAGGTHLSRGDRRRLARQVTRLRSDPRPWLILAHADFLEGARTDACDRYRRALDTDPHAAGDPAMLHDLVIMAAHRNATIRARAEEVLLPTFGAAALPAIAAARRELASDRDALDRLSELEPRVRSSGTR